MTGANPEEKVTLTMRRGTAVRWRQTVKRALAALGDTRAQAPAGSPLVEALTELRVELMGLLTALSDAQRG